MLPRHPCHLDRRLLPALGSAFDVYECVVEEVEIVDGGEGFVGVFLGGGEVGFGVWGCDDGKVAPKGGFDLLIEVVAREEGVLGL